MPHAGVSADQGYRFNILTQTRSPMNTTVEAAYKTYMCLICGFIYDEAKGLPEEGLAPGTRWEDIPMNWVCPECGARKEDFEMIEI
jgi:rubredoxin